MVTAPDPELWQDRGHFFMVADGMGAHAAGELASKLTVDGVAHLYQKYTDLAPPESLEKALTETNAEVHRKGQANSDFRNMGTTASVLVLLPQGALIAHIGDSRVYRLRGNKIEQLTFDHSLVWELMKAGQLSNDKGVAHSIPKNVITRSVGPNPTVKVDVEGPFPVLADDVFLLCSDGLTGKLEDHELAGILAYLDPDEASHLLIDLANLRGGPDNITAIVTKVVGDDLQVDLREQPSSSRQEKSVSSLEPIMWVAVSVGLLVALVLAMTDRLWAATGVAAVSVLFLVGALIARLRPQVGSVHLSGERRFGDAPYASAACPPSNELAQKLAALAEDIRRRDPPSIPIDWSHFDEAVENATQCRDENDDAEAIRYYATAVRALMVELRSAERRQASDSALDL